MSNPTNSVSDIGENEQITFSCPKCLASKTENAREFFTKVPSLRFVGELMCMKCDTRLEVSVDG